MEFWVHLVLASLPWGAALWGLFHELADILQESDEEDSRILELASLERCGSANLMMSDVSTLRR